MLNIAIAVVATIVLALEEPRYPAKSPPCTYKTPPPPVMVAAAHAMKVFQRQHQDTGHLSPYVFSPP